METKKTYDESELQRQVGAFVDREVILCVSVLVSELGKVEAIANEEDYHALHGGIVACEDCDGEGNVFDTYLRSHDSPGRCNECDGGEVTQEVFEHWVVTDWLAMHLRARGEVVGEFMGLTIWGRQCTGQAIMLDSVIRDIWIEVMK